MTDEAKAKKLEDIGFAKQKDGRIVEVLRCSGKRGCISIADDIIVAFNQPVSYYDIPSEKELLMERLK